MLNQEISLIFSRTIVKNNQKKQQQQSADGNSSSGIANPWNIPLSPPIKFTPGTETPWTEAKDPEENGGTKRTEPDPPKGGTGLSKLEKTLVIGKLAYEAGKATYEATQNEGDGQPHKEEESNTKENNSTNLSNNKGTNSTGVPKTPSSNIKPVKNGSPTPQNPPKKYSSPPVIVKPYVAQQDKVITPKIKPKGNS